MPTSLPAKSGPESLKPQTAERLPVFAALDLGTNNCRLLIARPSAPSGKETCGIKVLDTFSRIVRLGEGLSVNGKLLPEAMNRTVAALKSCKKKLERFDVAFSRFVATEACRQAQNRDEFLAYVKKETGLTIDVISNEEEARLAFLGCASLVKPNCEHTIVFDIGGGSTEFMWIERDKEASPDSLSGHHILDWLSLNQGVMNLSEKFAGTAFAEVYFDEMVGHLIRLLRAFDRKNAISEAVAAGKVQILSTSGTLTTLAAIHLGLTHYERSKVDGLTFSLDALRDAGQKILSMRPSERFANGCIGPDRSDYIISGCAIFEAICTLWPIPEITIADRGVREGIITSLMQEHMKVIS